MFVLLAHFLFWVKDKAKGGEGYDRTLPRRRNKGSPLFRSLKGPLPLLPLPLSPFSGLCSLRHSSASSYASLSSYCVYFCSLLRVLPTSRISLSRPSWFPFLKTVVRFVPFRDTLSRVQHVLCFLQCPKWPAIIGIRVT